MSHPVRFKPLAERDLEAATQWYDEQRDSLGEAFLNEVDGAVSRVSENP